jgi:hypothetical protein
MRAGADLNLAAFRLSSVTNLANPKDLVKREAQQHPKTDDRPEKVHSDRGF